jgi:hypothetical protein
MKYVVSSLVLSSGLLAPALASAQELGRKGDVVFSVDRLMGVTRTKRDQEGSPVTQDYTSISFGWRGAAGAPFDVPRLSFDYLPIDHLSVGGSLGYVSVDGENAGDYEAFIIAPRVGYAYAFGRVVGIWPRGGFTYHTQSPGDVTEKGFALSVEVPFTFSPTSHFAFHVGPSFDIDMFGSIQAGGLPKRDLSYRTFGINAGLLGWF